MVLENIQLHGFEELVKIEGKEGYLLQRVPTAVKETLSERGQQMVMMPTGNEVRFIPLDETVTVTLASYGDLNDEYAQAYIYFGDFQDAVYQIGTDPVEIKLTIPDKIKKYVEANGPFSYHPNLIRIILKKGNVHLIDIKGNTRIPNKDELPNKTLLSYGTSITRGTNASVPAVAFAKLTATKLHMDHINLGFGGSAYCENSITDYIASRDDWDILTLCISINMLRSGYTLDEYYERASYMIKTIAEKHPHKYIICISPLRYFEDVDISINKEKRVSTVREYRDALKNIVKDMNSSNIVYVDGMELLDSFGGLTSDLLHPGDYGMISIAEKLTKIIEQLV